MSDDNNHYQAPESNLVTPSTDEWGSVERGIAGDYQLSVGQVFSDAWELTKGAKGTIWLALIVHQLVIIGVVMVLSFIMGMLGLGAQAIIPQVIITFVAIVLVALPLMAGVMLIGINRSVSQPISVGLLFGNWSKAVPLVICYFLVTVLTIIGFLLFSLPGIYLSVAYMLAMPLIVEKGMGPWQAMETSRKGITKRWFTVFLIFIALMFVLFISMLPMGIGLIWSVPFSVMVIGVMYRNIFGVNAPSA